jgi:uncharacterized membrane protein YfcA
LIPFVVVCLTALLASALTLFSGFGLGTLLLPAFALFFPIEIAVSATALVHLANNLFKLALIGRAADRRLLLRFGLPAMLAALLGAWVLSRLTGLPPLLRYELWGHEHAVTPIGLAIATLILAFAVIDLRPSTLPGGIDPKWAPLGGAVSGFFGGLSGHQGALRSAFLINAGLGKEGYVGTGVACAVLVDIARLAVYGVSFLSGHFAALGRENGYPLLAAAAVAAFAGAFIAVRVLGKMTLPALRQWVGALLIVVALALGAGLF